MSKPLQTNLKKSGFSFGVRQLRGVRVPISELESVKPGTTITVDQVLTVGDVVDVQGATKGRGFAGAMKRHGFHGAQKTHGQSDRQRAVGSIGAGTTPGRVLKGKRMPGHFGTETQTVKNLVVVHIDQNSGEVWLSGPVPGSYNSVVVIKKTGKTKAIELNQKASGITVQVAVALEPEVVAQEQMPAVVENPAVAEVEVVAETPEVAAKPE